MQSTDPSAGPRGDPLDSCHNTTSRILSPYACLCARSLRILPIFVQCRDSPMKILPTCLQNMGIVEGHDGGGQLVSPVSALKLMLTQQVREEKSCT